MSMAGRKKAYPVHRKINCRPLTNNQTNMVMFADHELSKANHRLYRQSRMYSCKVDLDPSRANVVLDVYALSDTWMNQKAYQLAFEQFMTNSKEERSAGNDARWNDFRVKPGVTSGATLAGGGFEDFGTSFTHYPGGEYLYSEVHDTAGNTRTFTWVGATSGSQYNIIDEYDNTANTNATPSSPINTAAYDDLEDEVDDGQRDHLQNDGNNPPYGASTLPNQCFTRIATLSANSGAAPGGQKLSTGFFNAPCGIIVIVASAAISFDSDFISLEVKGGDYKGVHAPSMLKEGKGAVYASSSKSSSARHNVRIR